MIVLIFLQFFTIFSFFIFVILKRNVHFFGNSVLFIQILVLFGIILTRTLNQGVNLIIFAYIILVPLILLELSIFSSKRKPSKMKLFFLEFQKKLEDNFFNLWFFNVGSFYISRAFFKFIFFKISPLVKQPLRIINFFLSLWLFFWLILIYELIFDNRIYLSAIFLGVIFLINRFCFLFLKIIDYFAKENLNYLNSKYCFDTNKFPSFNDELYLYFQNKENLLKIQEKELDESSIEDHWNKSYSGLKFSSCIVFLIIFNKTYQKFSRLVYWISFLTIIVSVFLNFSKNISESFIFISVPIIIIIFLFINKLLLLIKDDDNLILNEIKRQIFYENVLQIFKKNFSQELSLSIFSEEIEFPPNKKPINIIHFFERNLIFLSNDELLLQKSSFYSKIRVLFYIFLFIFTLFMVIINQESFFWYEFSFFFSLFFKFKVLFFLLFTF